MSLVRDYRNFINGRYLNEGVRISAGILIPVFALAFFDLLPIGLVLSLGAICVSVADSPGPVHHRLNGMLYCTVIVTVLSVFISLISKSAIALGICIAVFGFIFSMLSIYGARASSIGIAGLLIMILSLQNPVSGSAIIQYSFLIMFGGCWYMLFSLLLYKIRPYKIIQQVLGDFISDVGRYLSTRANFYQKDPSYDDTYQQLLRQQISVQTEQGLLSELLFKSRLIIKESTNTGRVLVKIYIDVAELFESIMTTFQDYEELHRYFDGTGILEKFNHHILKLGEELNAIGLSVKTGVASVPIQSNLENVRSLREDFNQLRDRQLNAESLDHFLSLGRILNNLIHLTEQINSVHEYTGYRKKTKKLSSATMDFNNHGMIQDIRPAIFFNNLNFNSNIFRHALRVSFALLIGYIISIVFHIGHNYWILLTIVVIMKPAYSLTKKRNADRLLGTFAGILIGVGILYLIKDQWALIAIMIVCMIAAYSFVRTKYFISVLFMTPYLVIFFFFLYPTVLDRLLRDRLLDTAIGSGISFICSLFFIPAWEHETIKGYMKKMIESAAAYYEVITDSFILNSDLPIEKFRVVRKELLTSLANVSDAFNRMLSEPKRFQKNTADIHQFVVLNHMLVSHFATLSFYRNVKENKFRSIALAAVKENTLQHFKNALNYLDDTSSSEIFTPSKSSLQPLTEQTGQLMEIRKKELEEGLMETETKNKLVETKPVVDQFRFIYGLATDIARTSRQVGVERV